MKERKKPLRRCIGCMESKEKEQLIKVVFHEGKIQVDRENNLKGRGAYFCKGNEACLHNAYKRRALERNFNVNLSLEEKDRIYSEVRDADK